MLSIKELVEENTGTLKFSWYLSDSFGDRMLSSIEDTNTTAADLIGHLNIMHPQRVQVFGVVETEYFQNSDKSQTKHYLETLKNGSVPAIVIAEDIPPPKSIIEFCEINKVALLTSPIDASRIIDVLRVFLTRRFAPKTTVHGVFLDVLGVGVLITGESGLGKSELALELISRGHGLVADDAVEFARTYPNYIEGRCPELLRNLLEVRGLGLLDIRTIFGETAVRRKMSLKLIVNLVRANTEFFERLPMQEQSDDILGIPIRKVTLQVAAGRNLAVLVEAAVRNMVLKIRGIDTLSDFMKKQSEAILKDSKI